MVSAGRGRSPRVRADARDRSGSAWHGCEAGRRSRVWGKGLLGAYAQGVAKVLAFGVLFLAGWRRDAAPQMVPAERRGLGPAAVRLTIELSWGQSGAGARRGPGAAARCRPGSRAQRGPGAGGDGLAAAARRMRREAPGWGPAEGGGWRLGDRPRAGRGAGSRRRVEAKLIVPPGRPGGERAGGRRPGAAPAYPGDGAVGRGGGAAGLGCAGRRLGASAGDGIVAPGAEVPVSVGFNILWPEATEVTVRYSAVLRPARGGEIVSRQDGQEVLPTNRPAPSVRVLGLRAPPAEGAYVLEVQATWEPVVRDGSRLGRLIRRRKPAAAATSAVRRVTLTVLDPAARPAPAPADSGRSAREAPGRGRGRLGRPVAVADLPAAGLGPVAAGRGRPLGLGRARRGPDRAVAPRPAPRLVPAPGRRGRPARARPTRSGLAWSAVGLKVAASRIGPIA